MDVDFETQLQEDLKTLPPPRAFKGHPEVPFALTPDDLRALRPICEVPQKDFVPYGGRVKARRELQEAEHELGKMVEEHIFFPDLMRWESVERQAMAVSKLRDHVKAVGSP